MRRSQKNQSDFKFDKNNPLDTLVAMELYRLTGNYNNERAIFNILNDSLTEPLKNTDLNSLLLAQCFKIYRTKKVAQAAKIKLNDSSLLKNIIKKLHSVRSVRDFKGRRAENIYKLGIATAA